MPRALNDVRLFWLAAALIALIGAALAPAVPDMQRDDYAALISNADSLRFGLPYGQPDVRPDGLAAPAPTAYPPGYPLLLAAAIQRGFTGFHALAVLDALTAALACLLLMIWLRPIAGLHLAAAAGLLAGLGPFALGAGDLRADAAALSLLLAWLLAFRRREAGGGVLWSALGGLALGGALLIHPGLLGAPLAALLLRGRPAWAGLLETVLALAIAIGGLALLTPGLANAYADTLASIVYNPERTLGDLVTRSLDLPDRLAWLWRPDGVRLAGPADLAAAIGALALITLGAIRLCARLWVAPGRLELFVFLQLPFLLVLPAAVAGSGQPLALLVAACAIELAGTPMPAVPRRPRQLAATVLMLLACLPGWATTLAGRPDTSIAEPRTAAFINWLRDASGNAGLVLARHPRGLAVQIQAPVGDFHHHTADAAFRRQAAAAGATLIVFSTDMPEVVARAGADPAPEALARALDTVATDFLGPDAGPPAFDNQRYRADDIPRP